MLYKVYVDLCDFRVGSYVTLGTKATQSYYISTCHLDDSCQISLHLVYDFFRRFLNNFPLLAPFWGGAIYDPRNFICTNLNLLVPRSRFIPNINAFRSLVCERNIFQISKISPIVDSFWTPKGTSTLLCAHFNPHSLKILPTNFVKINSVVLEIEHFKCIPDINKHM